MDIEACVKYIMQRVNWAYNLGYADRHSWVCLLLSLTRTGITDAFEDFRCNPKPLVRQAQFLFDTSILHQKLHMICCGLATAKV